MRLICTSLALAAAGLSFACTDSPTAPLDAPAFDVAEIGGGCPDRFTLIKKGQLWEADYRLVGRDPADDNSDFIICVLVTKEPAYDAMTGELRSAGVVVLVDNDVPPEKIGKCPVTSTTLAVAPGTAGDLNANSVLCRLSMETEEMVYVDDIDS